MRDKQFISKLFRIAFPIALQSLMLALVAVADSFMLGNLEQNYMSAVSLATQIQFVQNMFLGAAVETSAILGAQYFGKGDTRTLNHVFSITMRFNAVIGIITFIGCVFFPQYLMRIFTNESELIAIGCDYLRIAGWSYLLTGLSQSYLAMMKVSGHPRSTAIISSCAVVINIILNAVFIFALKMGVRGAALATVVARVIELAVSIAISYKPTYIRFSISSLFHHDSLLFKDYCKCNIPLLGAFLLWGVGFTSYTAFMGHLGMDAAAANSISAVVRDMICCMCTGLASGGGIVVGNELGAGKLDQGRIYGDRIVKIAFIFGGISSVCMIIFTPIALQFVNLSEGATHFLYQMMIVMMVYMVGRTVNTIIINGIFAAGGDTLFDMYSLAVTMWGIAVPLAALGTFVFNWPVVVVYACTCLDEVGKIPWVMFHYKKYKWVKDLTR